MKRYSQIGIEVCCPGEINPNAPKWAKDECDEIKKAYLDAGGNNKYSLPLSSVEAVQLARDCADYAAQDDLEIDENALFEALQEGAEALDGLFEYEEI